MKKKYTAALMTIMLLLAFGACLKKETQGEKEELASISDQASSSAASIVPEPTAIPDYNPSSKLVGMLMPFDQGEFSLAAAHGFLRQAESLGYPAKLYRLENTEQSSVDEKVSEMVEDGCVGALVWASTDSLMQATQSLREAGIKTVVPYYEAGSTSVDANLSADPKDYGSEAARIMCEEILSRDYKSGVIVLSDPAIEPLLAQDFEEAIKQGYPQFQVQRFSEGANKDAIKKYVLETPDIRGALVLTPDMAIEWEYACKSVQNALKPSPTPAPASPSDAGTASSSTAEAAASAKPSASPEPSAAASYKRNIVLMGLDYSESNLEAVKSGLVFALVARPYYDSTAQSMAVLARLLRVLPTQTDVILNAPIVRKSGVDKYVTLRKEYISWFKGADAWFAPPSSRAEESSALEAPKRSAKASSSASPSPSSATLEATATATDAVQETASASDAED